MNPTPQLSDANMRMAECGGCSMPGWQLGWSQVIGSRHARCSEDSLAHGSHALAGQTPGSPHSLCLAVADGVGGGARGEIASAVLARHCVDLPGELFGHPESIARWMLLAEARVQHGLREFSDAPGAATLAAAWLLPGSPERGGTYAQGHILRVGDARVYHFDGHTLAALTADQTYASVGEAPPAGATPDDPARMVGTGFTGRPEVVALRMRPGDILLLCSDGLHRGLTDVSIAELLGWGGDLGTCARRMCQGARRAGSHDDITVLLARVRQPKSAALSEYSGLMGMLRKLF